MTQARATDLFRQEPEQFLDVGRGPELAYRRVGTGPDVLFVHGWPVSGATFRYLLPHLVDHVTCHLIDLPGTGQSRFDTHTPQSIGRHIAAVQAAIEALDLDQVALVGHDSGGMIARHAMAGDPRLRALGLVNTEQPQGLSLRFRMFLAPSKVPGFGQALGWAANQRRLRRNPLLLGDAFADSSRLDGEFDEFFLRPLQQGSPHLQASIRILQSFHRRYVDQLGALHQRIEVPVQLVWGDQDPFFPLPWAREMVHTFPDAQLDVIDGAGLFVHEEAPERVAKALLPVLTGERARRTVAVA